MCSAVCSETVSVSVLGKCLSRSATWWCMCDLFQNSLSTSYVVCCRLERDLEGNDHGLF
jgi:hypothetical protein